MRVVVDPQTGEQFEVVDGDLIGAEVYDYAQFRRASMTVSRQHRATIKRTEETGKAVAAAEKEYRKQLAITIPLMKEKHGSATIAEQMAKGEKPVLDAREKLASAEAEDRAAMEEVRLIRADRESTQACGYWSREAQGEAWEK